MGNVASLLPTQTAHGEPENAQVVKDESQTGCSLLDKFPFEIRRQIYGYLLVNPMLGQTESEIEFWESKKVQYIKYGPPPSILHTNRQIYHEALDVLYGSNVFYIYCCGQPIGHAGSKNDYVSPIRRFRPNRRYDDSRERKQAPLVSDAAALKVRHWKVVVSSEDAYEHFPSPVLIDACKMMYASRPRSLEVLTIPRGVEAEPDGRYHDLNVVLRLFQILRFPKGGFSLRDANFDEICPDFHSVTTVPIYISQLEGTDYPKQLLDTIKGNTAVEIGADMYCATLNYARCFEDISLSSMKWVLDGQNVRIAMRCSLSIADIFNCSSRIFSGQGCTGQARRRARIPSSLHSILGELHISQMIYRDARHNGLLFCNISSLNINALSPHRCNSENLSDAKSKWVTSLTL